MRAFCKKDLEGPIVESEYETLWGRWIRMANGWMLDLPEMASDTPLPITINARTRGKTGGLMKALPRIEFVNAADAKAILTDLAVRMRVQHCSVSRTWPRRVDRTRYANDTGGLLPSPANALPRQAKGNVWAPAQNVESDTHRSTVTALMVQAFARRWSRHHGIII